MCDIQYVDVFMRRNTLTCTKLMATGIHSFPIKSKACLAIVSRSQNDTIIRYHARALSSHISFVSWPVNLEPPRYLQSSASFFYRFLHRKNSFHRPYCSYGKRNKSFCSLTCTVICISAAEIVVACFIYSITVDSSDQETD